MLNLSFKLYNVWKRNLISYKRFVIPTLLVSFGEPLLYLIAFGVGLGAYVTGLGGKTYLAFLASGLIITSAMLSSSFECLYGTFIRMTHEKIFSSLIVTPASAEDVVAGEIMWAITRGLISGVLMFLVALLLGIAPPNLLMALFLFVTVVAVGFLFSSLSMIVTAFSPNFDFFSYYTELVVTPMFFFSGAFFPLDKSPEILKILANFLPLTHAVIISRALFAGNLSIGLLWHFLVLIIPAIIAFYFAVYFMKRRIIK